MAGPQGRRHRSDTQAVRAGRRAFLDAQAKTILAVDFFHVDTVFLRLRGIDCGGVQLLAQSGSRGGLADQLGTGLAAAAGRAGQPAP